MEQQGVMSKVEELTEWCAPILKRAGGGVRICSLLTDLNKSVFRERERPTLLSREHFRKVFSKLDANACFWKIPLKLNYIPIAIQMVLL